MSFMLSVNYAEFHKPVNYADCHYAECRYAECRGAKVEQFQNWVFLHLALFISLGWTNFPASNELAY
jgi:hypothetical protein